MGILVLLMGFAVVVFSYSFTFPGASHFRSGNWIPGPAFFPQVLAVILFIASATELIRLVRKRRAETADAADKGKKWSPGEWLADWGTQNALIILVMMFAFPFLVERVGFALMGYVVVFVITWRLKAGLAKSVVFSLLAVTLTMLFFRFVFFMDLPPGIWSPTQYFE